MKFINISRVLMFLAVLALPVTGFSKTIYMATDGNDANAGLSITDPVKTLSRVHELVDFSDGDTTVLIRGGVYHGESISWTKTSSEYGLKITAYGDEEPVFEGEGHPVFFKLNAQKGECTNVEISHLTMKHYATFAILLSGGRSERTTTWNGCNSIHNNNFVEIGTLYDTSNCSDGCKGYGVIDVVNSDNNLIYENVFHKAENLPSQAGLLHAVYLAHDSTNNQIHDNYIYLVSGDPIRVRDQSNNNNIYNNYADRVGQKAFLSSWHNASTGEQSSHSNKVKGNIVTFPYKTSSNIELTAKLGSGDVSTFIDQGQKYFHGTQIVSEEVGATAAGDFNGDGLDELLIAFNYDSFTKVVKATGGEGKYLKDVLYISPSFKIVDLAAGDFVGEDKDEIITAFELRSTGRTDIYRGDADTNLLDHGKIYSNDQAKVAAMIAGDFDGDGVSEIMTALKLNSDETSVYRGDGVSSILNMGNLYSSNYWAVSAMTAGDFSREGSDQVVMALQSPSETRIYRGNGTGSAINFGYFYSSAQWTISAMEANYFNDSNVPSLNTAFKLKSSGEVRLYNADGINSAAANRFYDSTFWDIPSLTSGVFERSEGVSLITSFIGSKYTQIWAGNGVTSASTDGLIHKLD